MLGLPRDGRHPWRRLRRRLVREDYDLSCRRGGGGGGGGGGDRVGGGREERDENEKPRFLSPVKEALRLKA